jgi:hypothetical protein
MYIYTHTRLLSFSSPSFSNTENIEIPNFSGTEPTD